MAENDKPGTNNDKDFEDFNEDLELDLFDDGSDADGDDALSEFADVAQESVDAELQEELGDGLVNDLDDTLEEDIIDLSDDDLKQEFADLDREEAQASTPDFDPTPVPDPVTLSDSLSDSRGDEAESSDPDDLYLNMTSEEFGAPDQYSSEYGANTLGEAKKASKATSKPAAATEISGLPTLLAALTALSPRMIVAATAAVLLPLVLFATLGFNADQSDADEATEASTFVDQSDSNTADNLIAADSPAPPIEPPEPERIQVPELPAADNPVPDAAVVAADDEPVTDDDPASNVAVETNASEALDPAITTATEPPDEPESALLLAQTDSGQPDPAQATDTPAGAVLERSVAATTQDADGQPLAPEPEVSEPQPVSDHSPESTLIEDTRTAGTSDVAVISETGSDGGNYHVVVASFATEEQARAHALGVSDEEIAAYVIPPFGRSTNYRVAVAGYSSMAEARENIPGLQAVYGSGIWPLRYPPSPPLQTISEQTGDTYIIVASFPTVELAQTHAGGLVADGEQPVIIAPYPPANRYRVAVSYFDSPTNAENALPRYRQNYGEDVWLLSY